MLRHHTLHFIYLFAVNSYATLFLINKVGINANIGIKALLRENKKFQLQNVTPKWE